MDLKRVSDIVDLVRNVATATGILVGGTWGYYRFVKGRVLKPRITLTIEGSLFGRVSARFLRATVKLQNVGLTRVRLTQKGSCVSIFRYQSLARPTIVVELMSFERSSSVPIFARHSWVEPAETLTDE